MSLDATARRRFTRQLLLDEIGESGQQRLTEAGFRSGADTDPDVYAVAADYLRRAGCPQRQDDRSLSISVDARAVARFSRDPSLRAPAAAVLGAVAAVEHLKRSLDIGRPGNIPKALTLQPRKTADPLLEE